MGERQDIPLPSGLVQVAVVLVGVTHPGNLGAICRSMLNYGFDDLRLVNPKCSPDDEETRARAKHAQRVLDDASVFASIGEAAEDCRAILGTSGKREVGDKTLFRHFLYPWDMIQREEQAGGRIAIVFGEEGKGLSTEDLAACDYFITLPTWEGYPIANLSHAVNAVVYEIHRSRVLSQQGKDPGLPDIVPLQTSMEPSVRTALLTSIEQWSNALSGPDERTASVEQTMKRTLLKGTPSNEESTRLIGAFVEATTALQFSQGDPNWKKEHRRRLS
ncbi:MAG: RNA methyltransferase [Poseidonia sp.]|jgi:tRNA/rRNA methyltransferase